MFPALLVAACLAQQTVSFEEKLLGKAEPEYAAIAGKDAFFRFSADGRSVLFLAYSEKLKAFALHENGKAGQRFPALSDPCASPDGNHIAFVAHSSADPKAPNLKKRVMPGTRTTREYDRIEELTVGNDGRPAYFARAGSDSRAVHGTDSAGRATVPGTLRLSDDGKVLAYVMRNADAYRVVVGKREDHDYPEIKGLVMDRSTGAVAYIAVKKLDLSTVEQAAAVTPQGRETNAYDDVNWVAVDPAGATVAFEAIERPGGARKTRLMLGRKELARDYPEGTVTSFMLSPDGKRTAYLVKEHRAGDPTAAVIDGVRGPACKNIVTLRFRPDGTPVYLASIGSGWALIADQAPAEPFTAVGTPTLAPDGRTLVYRSGSSFVVASGASRMEIPYERTAQVLFPGAGPRGTASCVVQTDTACRLQVGSRSVPMAAGSRIVTPPVFHADGTKAAFGLLTEAGEFWWKVAALE